MKKNIKLAVVALLLGTGMTLYAQDNDNSKPVYQITETLNVKHTPVDNQGSSGTCWCFAGIGIAVTEILQNCMIFSNGVHENITGKDVRDDKTLEDTGLHMMLAHMQPPHFPVAIGVIRDVKAPTFNDSLDQVIENEKANSKIHCMDDLLNSGSTWNIE